MNDKIVDNKISISELFYAHKDYSAEAAFVRDVIYRHNPHAMPGKMARPDPRPSARVTPRCLQEGRENANIDADLGFIWRISA
jgi:hypothetical protein